MKKTISKLNLYQRQTTLSEIGVEGQAKLNQAKVCIVGCGGLGCVTAVYLAASGVENLQLIDFDTVSESNLHRQVFYKIKDIGKSKAKVLAKYIRKINPFVKVSFSKKAIDKNNVFKQIKMADIVVDCTDNLAIKYLLNDACVLKNKPLVYGSLYKFDGYVATFNFAKAEGNTANLRDAFPVMPTETVPNCSEVGTLNTIVGIIGLMQANEVIKIITQIGKPLVNQLLIYNSLNNLQFVTKLKKKITKEEIEVLFEKENYQEVGCEIQNETWLITSKELKNIFKEKNNKDYYMVSVIDDIKTTLPFEIDKKIPLRKLEINKFKEVKKPIIVVCNKGISSYLATQKIKKAYPTKVVLSLEKGIHNYE